MRNIDFIFNLIGRHDDKDSNQQIINSAVFLSNLFHLTSDTHAPVIISYDLSEKVLDEKNVIIIGDEKCIEGMRDVSKLIRVSEHLLEMGELVVCVSLTRKQHMFFSRS